MLLGEFLNVGSAGKPIITYARENKKLKALNKAQTERKLTKREKGVDDMNINLQFQSKAVLTWENMCYYVPAQSGDLQLLDGIFGYIKPGQLTALMGASGAGKTTLLDVLAARKTIGKITGLKLIDGREPSKAFQRQTSYAEQLDILEPTSTVREALRFSADLRQSYTTSREDKYAYVEDVISLLEMEDIAEAIIGVPESGLAMEQRKRVTIAIELAAKPDLLLFLDEPTTGLDSQGAFNIVRFLKKLALSGQAVLCTIHQPNSVLFGMFDRLLLLQRGGQTVYFGEVGKDAQTVIEYFGQHGAYCPTNANPAEFMLDAIGAGQNKRIGSQDWADIWHESAELAGVKAEIADIKRERFQESSKKFSADDKEYATPLWHQCLIVCQRACVNMWRSADYGVTRLLNHLAVSLPSGLIFMGLGDSRTSMQSRFFVALQVTVLPAIILAQVEPRYAMARMLSYREQAAKSYKQFPFALSQVIAETPYSILAAIVFFLPLYYISGLKGGAQYAGYTFLAVLVTEIFAVTLGQMIAALTPSPIISGAVNPFIIVIFFIFCGVTIPPPQIPGFWKWLHELDPFTRLISGVVTTELQGREVDCANDELNRFTSPPGITCGEYMEEFFQSEDALGYLVDPEERDVCEYCAFASGEEFYSQFGFEYETRWRDMGIFLAFVGSNLVILFLAVSSLFLYYRFCCAT